MYTKEELELVVKQCNTYKQVFNYFKLNSSGGNYKILRKNIITWNIDISHFMSRSEIVKNANNFKKQSTESILIKNSKYTNGNTLKKRLYKEELKQPICEECNQGEEWRGKKMSLILEHIDGDHFNNEIKNLKILCPNCHAITDTFAGKNQKTNVHKIKRKEVKNKLKIDKKEELRQKILNSNIDFTKKGWGVKLSKILNTTPQYALVLAKKLLDL